MGLASRDIKHLPLDQVVVDVLAVLLKTYLPFPSSRRVCWSSGWMWFPLYIPALVYRTE